VEAKGDEAERDIPSGINEVTPQWLTEVFRADKTVADTATVTVTDVHAEQIALDTGFSSLLYRLHVTGDGDAPSSVIAKLPGRPEARQAMEMMGGYSREVEFYRQVSGRAPMNTPHAYAARIANQGADFVLVLEDLRNWDNADQLAGLSVDRVRTCIEQLAGLHAWSLLSADNAVIQSFPSLDTSMTREVLPALFGQGWQVYRDKSSAPVSSAVDEHAQRFAEHARPALDALTERRMLVHGDIRADNMFFAGDELKIVDFQLAATGAGAADIGYLVSQGLPSEVRRGKDEELLRFYLDLLARYGVEDYTFEDAWRHYRFAVSYLMVLPVIILIGWDSLPERSRALCLKLTDRAVATIDDIDALEVFG
jgi:aminoglycoside phosphotransferase (APT) family kinase protein